MEKILIISYSFPPDNVPAAQRPYFMAKYLQQFNLLETIVLTSHSSRSSLGKSNWADLSGLNIISTEEAAKEALPQSQPIVNAKRTGKIKSFLLKVGRELIIPDKGITWYKKGCRKAKEIMDQNPDIKYIYSTSPSVVNHQIAFWVKKKYNVKWIADFRDFYYCFHYEDGAFLFRHHFDKRIEKKIINGADHLTFILDGMTEIYREKYPSIISKSSTINNGFDPAEFEGKILELPATRKIKIFYGGSFYKGVRNPKWLLQALERLVENNQLSPDEIEIRIAGNIPIEIFDSFIDYKIFKSVKLLGFISRKNALEEMLNAHFLWLLTADEKRNKVAFPIKGYEYVGARRHILAFTPEDSALAGIVDELQCGTILGVNDQSLDTNTTKLGNLIDNFRKGMFYKPIQVNEELLKKYTRTFQAHQLFKLIQEKV
jgi:glycosyltransferase involved in cell wall biosynthesis